VIVRDHWKLPVAVTKMSALSQAYHGHHTVASIAACSALIGSISVTHT